MVSINYATREVCCKIVYYGPGLSGKTTNLQVVHEKVPQNTRGKLISLATEADRTLYFDFLPINIGSINGFAAKFQLYTVPGQVYYNATRRLVLRGVDGVVFVADSQAEKHDDNLESLSNLKENLEEYGYDVNELPIVIQYNKSDLPTALSQEELDDKLNQFNWPSHIAAAVDGVGVFDTLKAIMKLVLEKAKKGGTGARSKPKSVSQPASATVGMEAVASSDSSPAAIPVLAGGIAAGQVAREAKIADSQPVSQPVGAVASTSGSMKSVAEKTPAASSGGLFGAPRQSSGRQSTARQSTARMRHAAIGTGQISGAVDSATENSSPTGKIDITGVKPASTAGSQSGSQVGDTLPTNTVADNSASGDSMSENAGIEKVNTRMSMIGHDPLEQAPPRPKQKKPGFFSRLFGRK